MKYKRLTTRAAAAALCTVLGLNAAIGLYPAQMTYAAGYDKVDGNYQMLDGTTIEGAISRGIDVSRWQGDIDWTAVAGDDVDFVLLGTRSKGTIDPYFHTNVKGASAAGLKVGAYIYSLATTTEMAEAEADFILDLVKDYPISFPIAFDAEDSATLGSLPPTQVSEIINAFCARIKAAGYYPIVYANDYWLANKIDMSQMKHDVWVARYEIKHTFANPIMWQATSSGSIDGIKGNVDIDFLYKDLSASLPGNLWRTIGDKTFYYKNYVMQKDAWIHDGTGWFYMNAEGLSSTGWLEKAGIHYYMDDTSGKMVTGWKQLAGKWYFFNSSGVMTTGWLEDNGNRYYMNTDGTMAVGWQMDGTSKYFLGDNGAAITGWKMFDQTWYYFNPKGDLAHGWINPDGSWYYLNNDGKMLSGWQTDNGASYYLSTTSGKMTTGWRQIDGFWYYFNGSGAMVTGLTEIGGQTYYLNPSDGKMAVSTTLDFDGVEYAVDESGICTKIAEETGAGTEAAQTPPQTPAAGEGGSEGGQNGTGEVPTVAPVPESSAGNGGPGM